MNKFTKEIKELTSAELQVRYDALKKDIYELRFKATMGTLEKSSYLKKTKKNIARILTFMQQKKKGQEK